MLSRKYYYIIFDREEYTGKKVTGLCVRLRTKKDVIDQIDHWESLSYDGVKIFYVRYIFRGTDKTYDIDLKAKQRSYEI